MSVVVFDSKESVVIVISKPNVLLDGIFDSIEKVLGTELGNDRGDLEGPDEGIQDGCKLGMCDGTTLVVGKAVGASV